MRILTIFILINTFFQPNGYSCQCNYEGPFEIKELSNYEDVSFVRVDTILQVPKGLEKENNQPYHLAIVSTITHFKGESLDTILVSGGYRPFGIYTSCDIGLDIGEEWIIFANKFKGYSTVFECSRSTQYRSRDGIRDWRYKRGIYELDKLYEHFNIGNLSVEKDTCLISIYPNGNTELVESFVAGELSGKRTIYHLNGNLWGEENYHEGKLSGTVKWYDQNGNIQKSANYLNGVLTDTLKIWHNPINVNQLHYLRVYNEKGHPLWDVEFRENGNKKQEEIFDRLNNIYTQIWYYENGKKASEYFNAIKRLGDITGFGYIKKWSEEGELILHEKYLNGIKQSP